MSPEPPITGLHWYLGRSNHPQNIPYFAVEPPIGVQDTRHMSEDWNFGRQASDNEHTLYIRALFQIPNWRPGRSKMPLNENLFHEVELKHQKFTVFNGLIRKI
jgi:hypothetical protein